jgi:cobalt-zinc-cadmium efflux system membrane fusion protein
MARWQARSARSPDTERGQSDRNVVILPDAAGRICSVRASGPHPRQRGRRPSLSVPEEAVQVLDGRDVVFVRTPKGFRAAVLVGAAAAGRRRSSRD